MNLIVEGDAFQQHRPVRIVVFETDLQLRAHLGIVTAKPALGPVTFGEKEELIFLGRHIGEQRNYSEEIACQIDREVRKLVEEAYDTARQTILAHRDKLVEIAERLTREETLDAAAFNAMFA